MTVHHVRFSCVPTCDSCDEYMVGYDAGKSKLASELEDCLAAEHAADCACEPCPPPLVAAGCWPWAGGGAGRSPAAGLPWSAGQLAAPQRRTGRGLID